MRKMVVGVFAFALAGIPAAQAQPQPYEQLERACLGTASDDQRIEGCSAVIASGQPTGKKLADAFLYRGLAYFGLRRFDDAERDLERSARYSRRSESDRQAIDLLAGSWYDRTIKELDEAIKSAPGDAMARYNRGRAHQVYFRVFQVTGLQSLRDILGTAIQDFDQAIRLNPGFVDAFYHRGIAWLDKRQPDPAIRDFTEVIRLDPGRDAAFANRGFAYSLKSRGDLAMADYDEAIRLNPDNASALSRRGFAFYQAGELDKAMHDLDRAVELDPGNARTIKDRERVVATIRYRARLDEAIQKNPKDATAFHERALSYARLNQHRRAIRDYDEAVRLDPTYAAAFADRGQSYLAIGDYDRAIQDFDEAIRLKPRDTTFHSKREWAVQEKAKAGK